MLTTILLLFIVIAPAFSRPCSREKLLPSIFGGTVIRSHSKLAYESVGLRSSRMGKRCCIEQGSDRSLYLFGWQLGALF
ncbi:hypothetical protein ACM41_16480 [Bradyrhizobium sp. CCBAU 21362]|nr:hypothetical protein [Bradyrhizobium sp. CCBAU 21362]